MILTQQVTLHPSSSIRVSGVADYGCAEDRYCYLRGGISWIRYFIKRMWVTVQALGRRSGRGYWLVQDDIALTAFRYRVEPRVPFRTLPDRDALLEVV